MMVGITGTPGTGKSAVADELISRGYTVVSATATANPFITAYDAERDTREIDLDAWVASFQPVEGFVEGHLAHYLPCGRLVVLRCHPRVLSKRLEERGYARQKIMENAEAEAIDVILIESVEEAGEGNILEIDTTDRSVKETADMIAGFYQGEIGPSLQETDWSEWLLAEGGSCL
jgi:adenylate kinase